MTNDPLAPTVTVELGGKKYELVFDVNTFDQYEATSGKNFFETLERLMEFITTLQKTGDNQFNVSPLHLFKVLPVGDLRALVQAAIHTYPDPQGPPHFPLTIHQVGRLINMENITQVVMAVMLGQTKNQPTSQELEAAGEDQGPTPAPEGEADGPVVVLPPAE